MAPPAMSEPTASNTSPMAMYMLATNHLARSTAPRRTGCMRRVLRVPFSASPAIVWLPDIAASRGRRNVTRAKSDATATSRPLLPIRSKN